MILNLVKKFFLTYLAVFALFFVFSFSKAEILVKSEISIFYSSTDSKAVKASNIYKTLLGDISFSKLIIDDGISDRGKKVYVSPDHKLLAISFESIAGRVMTYIADLNGKKITSTYFGSFVSWSPSSDKVLVFLSGIDNEDGRKIYYLGIDNSFLDSGLPEGTINADISPLTGNIVYTLTKKGIDDSTIYIRETNQKDRILLAGSKNIYAWVRWSPKGEKIAFLGSDLGLSSAKNKIFVINSDGSELQEIMKVDWGFPPVWSSSGDKIIFSFTGNIFEYNIRSELLNNMTKFENGSSKYPSYSKDDTMIVFSSKDKDGTRQIWSINNGIISKITSGNFEKVYPIIN